MPIHTRVLLHTHGPALWPEHKPAAEVLALKASTLEDVWETTWQGNPTPPSGTVFRRSWWPAEHRYDAGDQSLVNACIARYLSLDTGMTESDRAAFTALSVGEILPDWRLVLRRVVRERLQFPDLVNFIQDWAHHFNRDGKLRKIVIEAKVSGISAFQTLRLQAPKWMSALLFPFQPSMGDKIQRASQAAVWCKLHCVSLPLPGPAAPWLLDFEDELFSFPNSTNKDQVDSLSQLCIFLENIIEHGYKLRTEQTAQQDAGAHATQGDARR